MTYPFATIRTHEDSDGTMFPVFSGPTEPFPFEREPGDGSNIQRFIATALKVHDLQSKKVLLGVREIKGECFITDSRIVFCCDKYDKGRRLGWLRGGWGRRRLDCQRSEQGQGPHRRKGKMLAGHVRFQWLGQVGGSPKMGMLDSEQLRLVVSDGTQQGCPKILIDLTLPKATDSRAVAKELVRRACAFRLARDVRPDERSSFESLALAVAPQRGEGQVRNAGDAALLERHAFDARDSGRCVMTALVWLLVASSWGLGIYAAAQSSTVWAHADRSKVYWVMLLAIFSVLVLPFHRWCAPPTAARKDRDREQLVREGQPMRELRIAPQGKVGLLNEQQGMRFTFTLKGGLVRLVTACAAAVMCALVPVQASFAATPRPAVSISMSTWAPEQNTAIVAKACWAHAKAHDVVQIEQAEGTQHAWRAIMQARIISSVDVRIVELSTAEHRCVRDACAVAPRKREAAHYALT